MADISLLDLGVTSMAISNYTIMLVCCAIVRICEWHFDTNVGNNIFTATLFAVIL
jgi:hypothetical protein